LPASSVAFGLHYQYAKRPLELVAPSGDPAGRRLGIVDHSHRLELRAAVGLGRGIDVSAFVPMNVAQTGAGSEGLSTQSPPAIRSSGLGDLRLGLRTRLPDPVEALDGTLRLEVSLPTGDEQAYLGEGNATETLATNWAFTLWRVLVATDVGITVTKPHAFADVRLGTRLHGRLGLALRILSDEKLTVAAETWIAKVLLDSPALVAKDDVMTRYHTTSVMPSEGHLTVSSRPSTQPIWVSLGAGTAFALSTRDAVSSEASRVDERFVAPTTPRLRWTAQITTRF
jgi:hypothetical protein